MDIITLGEHITLSVGIALLIATLIPVIVLYVIYTLDLYKTGAFRFILASFVWGIIAFQIAVLVNNWMIRSFDFITIDRFKRFSAPVVEEILKGLILVYLVRRPSFTYFVDGAIYGFAVGIGFAVRENFFYISNNVGIAPFLAINRVISTNLIHASASGMVGIAMGLSRFQRFSGRARLLVGGLVVAIATHMSFNNVVVKLGDRSYVLAFAVGVSLIAIGLIVYAIKRGLAEEKIWIEETLGMADRVTAGEAAVVHKLTDLKEILAPVAEIFPDKISEIEKFLVVQARLGIMRKTLEKLTDEKMRQGVRDQMQKLREEMDEARRSVGYGAMVYVRTIFSEEDSPLWGRLETLIQERAAARPASGGANLWGNLDDRLAAVDAGGTPDG